jgi:peptide/nickel transport system substrate-binding protein
MRRRTLLQSGALTLAVPRISRAQSLKILRHIPEADLAVLDPIWTTANVTRNHGFMVFDTLYGADATFNSQRQMVGEEQNEGLDWTFRLRPGLKFHDNAPVLARDVLASLTRWASRDSFGQALTAAAHEITATDDRTFRIRLKQTFPVIRALTNSALIMPERLAATDSAKPINEMVGSGPFRFLPDERIAGVRVAYARFEGYVPRDEPTSYTAGSKQAFVDRVEWNVIPDVSTAASAMIQGEADWWGPTADLIPQLRKSPRVRLETIDTTGGIAVMRFNHLHPPFDNAAIRRALLPVVEQAEFMTAVVGDDRSLWRDGVGFFTPGSPMASNVGMEALMGPRSAAAAHKALDQAGYRGEKVVIMNPADLQDVSTLAVLGADVLKRAGMNVDLQTMDWGTLIQRRSKMDPPAQGGWNMVFTSLNGSGTMDPAGHIGLRANGTKAWAGWPTSERLEALRTAWFDTSDVSAQHAICEDIQRQAFQDVPYIPLGQRFGPYAFNVRVHDVPRGFPLFYGVKLA